MGREFTQDEADRHNALTDRAWSSVDSLILLEKSSPSSRPNWFARRKLRKAIDYFRQALDLNPDGWQAMWGIGKIYQRLGEHELSLEWFEHAHEKEPSQPDVAREAGLAARECGRAELGLKYCMVAVEIKPNDPGLMCNLALAHMIAGDDTSAVRWATDAVAGDPADDICKNVLRFAQEVTKGTRSRPRKIEELLEAD